MSVRKPELHKDHRLRMRRRFMAGGLDLMSEHEVLEMLLYAPIPRRDTNEMAHELLALCNNSVADVLGASAEELESVKGIGHSAASYIRLIGDTFRRVSAQLLADIPLDNEPAIGAYALMTLGTAESESAAAVYTDSDGVQIAREQLYRNDLRKTADLAIYLVSAAVSHKASQIVLMHNHRHEPLIPSTEDRALTASIRNKAAKKGIALYHAIVSGTGYIFV